MQLTRTDRDEARNWLCRTLSPWLADAPPTPPSLHLWPEIVRLADAWLVSSRLHRRMAGTGIIPAEADVILRAISDYADLRSDAMRAELQGIIIDLNAAGLEPVLMKGAEWLMGHYAPGATRLVGDLDIWLPTAAEQDAALQVMVATGYAPMTPIESHVKDKHHHFPPFHREGTIARIEVHHRLIRATLADAMDLQGAAERLRPIKTGRMRYRLLSPLDGVGVAFLQSGRMAAPGFATRRVAVAKWLDVLDRARVAGMKSVANPRDLGILDGPDPVDIQLLTALSVKFGFPYSGPVDTTYIDTWAVPPAFRNIVTQGLQRSLNWENLTCASAWRRFFSNLPKRLHMNHFTGRL